MVESQSSPVEPKPSTPATTEERPHVERCPHCQEPRFGSLAFCHRCSHCLLTEPERLKRTGLGGWLGLAWFSLLVIGPLFTLVFLVTAIDTLAGGTAADRLRVLGPFLLIVVQAAGGIYVGVSLVRRSPNAILLARLYFLTVGPFIIGMAIGLGFARGSGQAGEFIGQMIGPFVFSIVWAKYFRDSTRIRLTYETHSSQTTPSRRAIALVCLVTLLVATVPAMALRTLWPSIGGAWIEYAPTGGGFRVEVPGEPIVTKETINNLLMTDAIVEVADNVAFEVAYLDAAASADLSDVTSVLTSAATVPSNT